MNRLPLNRRSFLRSAAPAAVAAVAAAPALGATVAPELTPEARARRAWADFCDAMADVTDGEAGWTLTATMRHDASGAPAEPFATAFTVRKVQETTPCGRLTYAAESRGRNIAL